MSVEIVDRLVESYRRILSGFKLHCGDELVAVTDAGVEEPCRIALDKVVTQLREGGLPARVLMSDVPTGPAQDLGTTVEGNMVDASAILYHTSMSRSHCIQTHRLVLSDRPFGRPRARLISITNGFADTLLVGAINENLAEMRARIERINTFTEGMVKYHITAPNGTDLWVVPMNGCTVNDDGLIDEPGKLGNFPFGEGRSTAVRFFGTGGWFVSDQVAGAGLGRLKAPISMFFHNGRIETMKGGEEYQRLLNAMWEADDKMPRDFPIHHPSFMIAELAFGANAAAWREEDGKKVLPPTSLEAEKAYDPEDTSIHIANGANHIFGVPKGDRHYNPVGHHTDHVLWGKITVVGYYGNGQTMTLINQGRPIY